MNDTEAENGLLKADMERLIAEAEDVLQQEELERVKGRPVDRYQHSTAVAFWCRVSSGLVTRGDLGRGFMIKQWQRMSRARGEELRRDMAAYARQSDSVRVRVFVLEMLKVLPGSKQTTAEVLLPLHVPGLEVADGVEHAFRYRIVLASLFHGGGAIGWIERAGSFAREVTAGL
ncbi:MAG TPA: hypothetical protein VGH19_16410 [Verrucomicrobiae bacterium]